MKNDATSLSETSATLPTFTLCKDPRADPKSTLNRREKPEISNSVLSVRVAENISRANEQIFFKYEIVEI